MIQNFNVESARSCRSLDGGLLIGLVCELRLDTRAQSVMVEWISRTSCLSISAVPLEVIIEENLRRNNPLLGNEGTSRVVLVDSLRNPVLTLAVWLVSK